jgi:hypothetical protein
MGGLHFHFTFVFFLIFFRFVCRVKKMEQLIEDSLEVLSVIDEAIAANDPYNIDFPREDEEVPCARLSDCAFPDHIADPLALLRAVDGHKRARELEYIDDLEYTADMLWDCVKRCRQERTAPGVESPHGQEVQREEGRVRAGARAGLGTGP